MKVTNTIKIPLLLTCIITAVFFVFGFSPNETEQDISVPEPDSSVIERKETLPKEDDGYDGIKVIVGGDVMLDRDIRRLGQKYSYDFLFENIAPLFRSADITIINLEGPITDEQSLTLLPDGTLTNSFTFTFAPETSQVLFDAGISVVSLANNHTDNFGGDGLEETKKYLEEAGLTWFGSPWNEAGTEEVICKKEICVALVGYHAFQPGFENILRMVEELEKQNYFIIVMPHWGEEYTISPSELMKTQARELALFGADAVIGTHPHVVALSEWLENVPVYYSLGNLLFDQYFSEETMNGLVVELSISNHDGKPRLDNLHTIKVSNASRMGITLVE